MIEFFCVKEDVSTFINRMSYRYQYDFNGVDFSSGKMNANNIFFTTVSDFNAHLKYLDDLGKRDIVEVFLKEKLFDHPKFPKDWGFNELEKIIQPFKDKKVRIAVLNGMSTALGDHLIGMKALSIFVNELSQHFPRNQFQINLFQLNPQMMAPVNDNFEGVFDNCYTLPNRLMNLMEHDVYFDFGGMVEHEQFDKVPMIDFFLKGFSLDPDSILAEDKRMQYEPKEKLDIRSVFTNYTGKRPVLLFHHKSTTPLRTMDDYQAQRLVKDIIKKSDYFVVSALNLDCEHKRFLNLAPLSESMDDFAYIMSKVDAVCTVDTMTYHLADALDKPTVVFFTSIDPDLRIRYYPKVKGIVLYDDDSPVKGWHKMQDDKHASHVKSLWRKIKVDDVLNLLKD